MEKASAETTYEKYGDKRQISLAQSIRWWLLILLAVSVFAEALEESEPLTKESVNEPTMMKKDMPAKVMETSTPSPHQLDYSDRCLTDHVALGGYDLVSYFDADAPVMGKAENSARHHGLTYHFSTPEHRDTFMADPERFLPEYAGWCAVAVAMGTLTCPDYLNYKIENSRLLLFETTGFTNGRAIWDSNPSSFRQRADKHFATIGSAE